MMINWGWEVDGNGLVSFTNCSTVFACQCCSKFLFHCRRLVSFIARDGPRRGSATGRLQIWPPLKSIFFKHFWPGTGLVKIFEGACPNCRFSFSCGNLSLLIHHVSDYSSDVFAPLIFWHPGQLWLTGCIITSFLFCQYSLTFRSIRASKRTCLQVTGPATRSLHFVGTAVTGTVQRNTVWSKAGCDVIRYNRKKGLSLSIYNYNANNVRAYINCHISCT
jgi:hypothetical protein